ncbi:aldolase/citrate lyase family protein [Prolixibacteraceae bacterium Z1-6]|uniref:Aldolase/citrate lyase family protein n=1 Tax=Draconibacterium aestuarii TaxID=2998507 RepID=A0A9X3FBD9_9BACT|nr:aldolase/citrate lyase family protein [Prolixibacteraceae bacterium Z1-6]
MSKLLSLKLEKGNTIYGTCVSSMAPLWSKAVGNAGLDFVFIDTEHIPLERMEVAAMCQLYAAQGIAPIVRIPSPDPYKACQMIDAGAEGIVAPYVESEEQIKDMVGALKYKPLKGEKLKAILEHPKTIEPDLKGYVETYNRGNLCIINIESIPAVEKLDELLKVPGLDGVFIGPHDLSVNMGLPEMYDHPEFEKVVAIIIKKCRENNIAVGIHFSESPERQVKWISEGANIVIHSSDIAIFSQQLSKDINKIRNSIGDVSHQSTGNITI